MSFYWILVVTVAFYLESTKGQISDELYVVKHPHSNELTCISDDDDAALVWNYDLSTTKLTGRFNNFEPVKPIKDISSYNFCAIWRSRQCWIKWYENTDWRKVSALANPMAPVVDYRWEGFKEYVVHGDIPQKVMSLNSDDGTAVFSFRGAHNIRIHLCHGIEFHTSRCIVIRLAIGGKYSAIESCQLGDIQCDEELRTDVHKYSILDAYEWRTFRLQLIGNEQMVKVFRGTNENAFLQAEVREWDFIQSIWISSAAVAGIRLHNYNYNLAEKANAKVTSAKFHLLDKNFCAKMLVSLCPDCHLIVSLVDSNTGETLIHQNIYGNVNFYSNGLRTWQSVKVTLPLRDLPLHRVQLQMKTGSRNDYNTNVWWAFDDIRVCERNDGVRKSTIALPFWNQIGVGSEIKCQKLLGNKIVVADSSNGLPSNYINWLSKYIRRLTETRYSWGRTSNTADCDHTSNMCPTENNAMEETEASSQPENLEMTPQSRGIVMLKWSYPMFAPRKMVQFHIEAHRLNTNRPINLCTENSTVDKIIAETEKQSFNMKFDVQTSTEYQLYLYTVDHCNSIVGTVTKLVSISNGYAFFIENQLLSNFKKAVVELEVPAVANEAENTRVVVTVKGVSSCESNALEDLSPAKDWTKPLMERVIAEFPISGREPVNSTFATNEHHGVEEVQKLCHFQHPGHYWFVVTLKNSKPENFANFNSSEVDQKVISNRSQVWLVIIPVLVIALLLLILFIWYRRHERKIPAQTSHSPDVPSEPLYLVPLDLRAKTSRVKNNSSNSPHATIPDDSREQSSDAQDASFPPLYIYIPHDSEERANYARNNSVTPLYVNTSDNSREQTDLSQDIPSDSNEQTSHVQSVRLSPLYTNVTYDLTEQTNHVRNIPDAPLYANTSDNSTEHSNHAQDDPSEPLYLKILDN